MAEPKIHDSLEDGASSDFGRIGADCFNDMVCSDNKSALKSNDATLNNNSGPEVLDNTNPTNEIANLMIKKEELKNVMSLESDQRSSAQASLKEIGRSEEGCDSKEPVGDTVKDVYGGSDSSHIDPYGYLQRGDFSSEIYKIEITNLPPHVCIAQIKKKMVHLGLSPCKIKSIERSGYAFVTFRSEVDREQALNVLEGHVWKSRTIHTKKAAANADPLQVKRKQNQDVTEEPDRKVAKPDLTHWERLNDAVTPLWKLPYSEQLQTRWEFACRKCMNGFGWQACFGWSLSSAVVVSKYMSKEKSILSFLRKLDGQMDSSCFADKFWRNARNAHGGHLCDVLLHEYVEQLSGRIHGHYLVKKVNNGVSCVLLPIKPSPVVDGYRNKCEFTIGVSPDGKDNTVGFRLSSYRDGVLSVLEPTACLNISQSFKTVAMRLQTYLQTRSTLPAFNPSNRSGYWQMATVRTTVHDHILLSVVIHPQQLSQEDLAQEKEKMKVYLSELPEDKDVRIASLYFEVSSDRRNEQSKDSEMSEVQRTCEHLAGEKYIEETLLGMKFRISPSAFFQVNTLAAEELYRTIGDWCSMSKETILLDVCCGAGTIGLTLAKSVKKVVGIEMNPEAIEDAKVNAQTNGITNAEFHCSKAEDFLPSWMDRFDCSSSQDIVAVVDPPRAGLHTKVVRAIRRHTFLQRVIYVACKPSAAMQNIIDLTRQRSKRFLEEPFRVMQAAPIDLFPHTEHCELIILLERNIPRATDSSNTTV